MQQNVKTRLRARWVFSSWTIEGGQGTNVVTGSEKLEALRTKVGGALDLGIFRGFVPPS